MHWEKKTLEKRWKGANEYIKKNYLSENEAASLKSKFGYRYCIYAQDEFSINIWSRDKNS